MGISSISFKSMPFSSKYFCFILTTLSLLTSLSDISQLPYEQKVLFKEVPIDKETIDTSVGTIAYFYHITPGREYKIKNNRNLRNTKRVMLQLGIGKIAFANCTCVC